MTKLESIRKHGVSAHGRRELMNYLKGKDLAMKDAILARCYDCMSYYADGISDCRTTECPLYVFMPYRNTRRKKKTGAKKPSAGKPAAEQAAKKAAKKAVKKETAKKPKKKAAAPVGKRPATAAPAAKKNGRRKDGKKAPEPLTLFKM